MVVVVVIFGDSLSVVFVVVVFFIALKHGMMLPPYLAGRRQEPC